MFDVVNRQRRDEFARKLVGKTFGRLTVLRPSPKKTKKNTSFECICACGKKVEKDGTSLLRGFVRSCGCLVLDVHRIAEGEAARNVVIRRYKQSAKRNKIPYLLTPEQATSLFAGECFYCGASPSRVYPGPNERYRKVHGEFVYNGIDRIENDKGYMMDNVVSCCWDCNRRKGDLNWLEFLAWVKRIAARFA